MNALRTAGMRVAGRRFASSIPLPKPPVPKIYQNYSFKETWMTDPSTYPMITIMTFAMTFMTGMGISCLMNNEDVHITPKYRKDGIIRSHGYERNGKTVISKLAMHEGLTGPEGLGVDHDEWVKQKNIKDPIVYSDTHHETLYHPRWLP